MFSSLWIIQKIRKIRKKPVFPDSPEFWGISEFPGISGNFLLKNDMSRQKNRKDMSKNNFI